MSKLGYIDKEFILTTINAFIHDNIDEKSKEDLIEWIKNLRIVVSEYRQPYQCSTCKSFSSCSFYEAGCRNCSGWH